MPHLVDDAPIAGIKEVFADIEARIAPAVPLLVYLRARYLTTTVRGAHAERCNGSAMWWPCAEQESGGEAIRLR